MYPSEYANVIQALVELMQEQNLWTPEAAFFARYFCKAAGIRAVLPSIKMVQVQNIDPEITIDTAS